MSEQFAMVAEVRTSFGKGSARKSRAAGRTPAVIYGHKSQPQHITLPAHDLLLVLRHKNSILNLDIAGKKNLVLVKDVQKDVKKTVAKTTKVAAKKTASTAKVVDKAVEKGAKAVVKTTKTATKAAVKHTQLATLSIIPRETA